eukprot:184238_1
MSAISLIDKLIEIIENNKIEKTHYIFGFGSLINTTSRNQSYKTDIAYPVRVHNYKRRWNRLQGPTQPWMGIIPIKNCTVNGVIFKVDNEMIKAFDNRELKWGYTRKQISIENIELLTNKITLNDKNDIIETYELTFLHQQENNNMDVNSEEYKSLRVNPQCYVDIVIKGCMEYGEEFVKEFIRTMFDWRFKWNLNRCDADKRRSWNLNKNECEYVDKMLKQYITKYHHFIPLHLQ